MFIKLLLFTIESTRFQGGGGSLHFNVCHGEAAGVGHQYNRVGVPTTFGRHCSSSMLVMDLIVSIAMETTLLPLE